MTKYTADEVRAARSVIAVECGRRRDAVQADYKQQVIAKVYLNQAEALVWAAGEYLKTTGFCKGCEGYQKEIAELVRKKHD